MKINNGFSLLELTIVLGITLVIGAGILMQNRNNDYRHINNASNQLQADLQYAQRRAIMEGRRIGLHFNMEGTGYVVRYMDSFPFYYVINHGVRTEIREVIFENGIFMIDITGENNWIGFTPSGRTSVAGSVYLRNRSGRYTQRTTVTPVSGRINVESAAPLNE